MSPENLIKINVVVSSSSIINSMTPKIASHNILKNHTTLYVSVGCDIRFVSGSHDCNRPDLESAIFETCMFSTFILQSFKST